MTCAPHPAARADRRSAARSGTARTVARVGDRGPAGAPRPRTVGEVTEATRTADGAADPSVDVAAEAARIADNIGRVVQGKPDVVRLALVVLLAEGHLLIEDVPGVGKTTLAKALAASIDATVRRIQFTPDLLPSDVTGVAVYDQESREFEFKPGAIFANVVVADEINRASPEDAVGAAGVHGGAPGHRRRRQLRAGPAVPGDGDAEPARDGGHLSPARGAARPVHRPGLDGLPRPGRRAGDARRPRRPPIR